MFLTVLQILTPLEQTSCDTANAMQLSPFCETKSSSDSQEIVQNQRFIIMLAKVLSLVPIISQINLVHALPSCLFTNHLNCRSSHLCLTFSVCLFPYSFPYEHTARIPLVPYTSHAKSISCSSTWSLEYVMRSINHEVHYLIFSSILLLPLS